MSRFVRYFAAALTLAGCAAAQDQPIRIDVDLVNILFTVKAKKGGALIPNLEKSNFTIQEDGAPQTIQHFSRETDLPLTLGLLIDISASQERLIDIERQAASAFFSSVIRPKDEAFLISFGKSTDLLQDYTNSPRQLSSALRDLRGDGGGRQLLQIALSVTPQRRLRLCASRSPVGHGPALPTTQLEELLNIGCYGLGNKLRHASKCCFHCWEHLMSKVIALFGAGTGLGVSVARRFGREGFRVALVARRKERLDALVADLADGGIEAAARIRRVAPKARIVFLSQHKLARIAEAALASGGHAYVVKSAASTDLIPAIQAVAEGKQFVSKLE